MENKEFSKHLESRTKKFAISIIKLSEANKILAIFSSIGKNLKL